MITNKYKKLPGSYDLKEYLYDFFKESPYDINICPIEIYDEKPGVRITITSDTISNKCFYLGLIFYRELDESGQVYYKPLGSEDKDVKYTKEDVLAFILSTLLNCN